jgi:hypothetical protein
LVSKREVLQPQLGGRLEHCGKDCKGSDQMLLQRPEE